MLNFMKELRRKPSEPHIYSHEAGSIGSRVKERVKKCLFSTLSTKTLYRECNFKHPDA